MGILHSFALEKRFYHEGTDILAWQEGDLYYLQVHPLDFQDVYYLLPDVLDCASVAITCYGQPLYHCGVVKDKFINELSEEKNCLELTVIEHAVEQSEFMAARQNGPTDPLFGDYFYLLYRSGQGTLLVSSRDLVPDVIPYLFRRAWFDTVEKKQIGDSLFLEKIAPLLQKGITFCVPFQHQRMMGVETWPNLDVTTGVGNLSPVLREDELQIIGNTPTQKAVVSCCQTGTLEVEIQDEGTFESKELGFTAGSGLRVRQLVLTLFPISIVAIFLLKTQLMQLLVLAIVFVFSLILSISYKRFLHEAKWQSQITLSESVVAKNFEGVQEQTMVKCTINNIGPANMRGSFVHFCWVDETSSIVALQTLYLRIMAGESMEKNLVFTAPIPENATLVLRLAPVSIP